MIKKTLLAISLLTLLVFPALVTVKAANSNANSNANRGSTTTVSATVTAVTSVSGNGNTNKNANGNLTKNIKPENNPKDIDLNGADWKEQLNQYKTAAQANKITELKELGMILIQNRIEALNSLQVRLNEMTQLDATVKAQLQAKIEAAIAAMNELATKIQNGTDLNSLKADIRSIGETHKIYEVVLPSALGEASTARAIYVLGRLEALEAKLQNWINRMDPGADKTAIATLQTQFEAKITDAQAQLEIAETQFKQMTPANTEAARTSRVTGKEAFRKAKQDLKDAHDILKQIMTLIKKNLVAPSASTSVIVTPTASISVSPSTSPAATVTASPTASASASVLVE